jgi:hypothetical protein
MSSNDQLLFTRANNSEDLETISLSRYQNLINFFNGLHRSIMRFASILLSSALALSYLVTAAIPPPPSFAVVCPNLGSSFVCSGTTVTNSDCVDNCRCNSAGVPVCEDVGNCDDDGVEEGCFDPPVACGCRIVDF